MPFKSKKQRRWMFANHPEMAKRWAAHTPNGAALPEQVKPEQETKESSVITSFYKLGRDVAKKSVKPGKPELPEDARVVALLQGRIGHGGIGEQILATKDQQGRAPDVASEEDLKRTMLAGSPAELRGVETQLGVPDFWSNYSRIFSNPRTSLAGKTLGALTQLPATLFGDPEQAQQSGPYYNPLTDVVFQPWDMPQASMHEYGHAIDFNKGEIPKSWIGRQAKGLVRDAYTFLPFPGKTLWQEHAAWRKGQDAYLRGAAETKAPRKDVEKMLGDAAHSKYPALGSYWGGTIGTVGALGTLAAIVDKIPPGSKAKTIAAILAAGGGLGALGGLGVGALMRNKAKAKNVASGLAKFDSEVETSKKTKKKEAAYSESLEPDGFFSLGQTLAKRGHGEYVDATDDVETPVYPTGDDTVEDRYARLRAKSQAMRAGLRFPGGETDPGLVAMRNATARMAANTAAMNERASGMEARLDAHRAMTSADGVKYRPANTSVAEYAGRGGPKAFKEFAEAKPTAFQMGSNSVVMASPPSPISPAPRAAAIPPSLPASAKASPGFGDWQRQRNLAAATFKSQGLSSQAALAKATAANPRPQTGLAGKAPATPSV